MLIVLLKAILEGKEILVQQIFRDMKTIFYIDKDNVLGTPFPFSEGNYSGNPIVGTVWYHICNFEKGKKDKNQDNINAKMLKFLIEELRVSKTGLSEASSRGNNALLKAMEHGYTETAIFLSHHEECLEGISKEKNKFVPYYYVKDIISSALSFAKENPYMSISVLINICYILCNSAKDYFDLDKKNLIMEIDDAITKIENQFHQTTICSMDDTDKIILKKYLEIYHYAKEKEYACIFGSKHYSKPLDFSQLVKNGLVKPLGKTEASCLLVLSNGLLASGNFNKTIEIWNVEKGECIKKLEGHIKTVTCLADLHNGQLASGSEDGSIKIWNIEEEKCIRTICEHAGPVTSVTFSPDRKALVSGSKDKTIKIWDIEKDKCIKTLELDDAVKTVIALSKNTLVYSAGCLYVAHIGKFSSIKTSLLKTKNEKAYCACSFVMLLNGQLAAGGYGNVNYAMNIWDLKESEQSIKTLVGHNNCVTSIVSLPNNHLLSYSSDERVAKIWNLEQETCILTLSDFSCNECFTLLPNGKVVFSDYNALSILTIPMTQSEVTSLRRTVSEGLKTRAAASKTVTTTTSTKPVKTKSIENKLKRIEKNPSASKTTLTTTSTGTVQTKSIENKSENAIKNPFNLSEDELSVLKKALEAKAYESSTVKNEFFQHLLHKIDGLPQSQHTPRKDLSSDWSTSKLASILDDNLKFKGRHAEHNGHFVNWLSPEYVPNAIEMETPCLIKASPITLLQGLINGTRLFSDCDTKFKNHSKEELIEEATDQYNLIQDRIINNNYDLFLMSVKENDELPEASLISKKHIPLVIKKGDRVYIYGIQEDETFTCTELDAAVFDYVSFPKPNDPPIQKDYVDLNNATYDEIILKKGHPRGNYNLREIILLLINDAAFLDGGNLESAFNHLLQLVKMDMMLKETKEFIIAIYLAVKCLECGRYEYACVPAAELLQYYPNQQIATILIENFHKWVKEFKPDLSGADSVKMITLSIAKLSHSDGTLFSKENLRPIQYWVKERIKNICTAQEVFWRQDDLVMMAACFFREISLVKYIIGANLHKNSSDFNKEMYLNLMYEKICDDLLLRQQFKEILIKSLESKSRRKRALAEKILEEKFNYQPSQSTENHKKQQQKEVVAKKKVYSGSQTLFKQSKSEQKEREKREVEKDEKREKNNSQKLSRKSSL